MNSLAPPADPVAKTRHRLARPAVFSQGTIVCLAATLISIVLVSYTYRLWSADLSIPLHYNRSPDVLVMSTWVKGVVENGWFLHNPSLGAPQGLDMQDFPIPDTLQFLIIRLISTFSSSYGFVLNSYYLLGYVLATWTALFALRVFGISWPFATTGALLFSFLPYHFLRGQAHILFSSYYLVPLAAVVMVWLGAAGPPLFHARFRPFQFRLTRHGVIALVICILIGSGGVYYAFFSVLLLAIAGIRGASRVGGSAPLIASALLIAVITGVLALNLLPSLLYTLQHGPNHESAHRSAYESELYGMKIIQLLVPPSYHRLETFRNANSTYHSAGIYVSQNENDTSSLGLIGSAGFLLLIFLLVAGSKDRLHGGLLNCLSGLNISAVLIGTIGGFGAVFAYLVSPMIRSYTRISIVIAFFALAAAMALAESLIRRMPFQHGAIRWAACGILLALGLLDQTSATLAPDHTALKLQYTADARFIRQIEQTLGAGSMIFQLPYSKFPENGPTVDMEDYDQLRGYLHSGTLRWGYGAIRGRFQDAWLSHAVSQPPEGMLRKIAIAGFNGIYIDRFGYTDRAHQLESQLSSLLNRDPVAREDQRIAFFDIRDYAASLRNQHSLDEWRTLQDQVLHPLHIQWTRGFHGLESSASAKWRWCAQTGIMAINNTADTPQSVHLSMSVHTAAGHPATLRIYGPLLEETISIGPEGASYSRNLTVPPGRSSIRFKSDAPPLVSPADPRSLVFRLENFRVDPISPSLSDIGGSVIGVP